MPIVEEFQAQLRLLFQYLSLGEIELSKILFCCICTNNADAGRQLLQHVLQLPALPFDFSELESHRFCRLQWSLAAPYSLSVHSIERLMALTAQLRLLAESRSTGQQARNDLNALKEAIEALSDRQRGSIRRRSLDRSALQSLTARIARHCPMIFPVVLSTIRTCHEEHDVPREVEYFLRGVQNGLLSAVDSAVRSGRGQEACHILPYLDIAICTEADRQKVLGGIVHHSSTSAIVLTQAAMSNPSTAVAILLQKELDAAQLTAEDAPEPRELFFSNDPSRWSSTGFQEARVRNWHTEAITIETVLEEIGRNKFDILEKWQPQNKRLLSLVVLMGWDMLSAQNTASTFPLKKKLLETTLHRVPRGRRSEFSSYIASLSITLKLSELLSSSFNNLDAGNLLTQFRSLSPQEILSRHCEELSSDFIISLAKLLSSMHIGTDQNVIRDLQLVLGAGAISAVVAFLVTVSGIFNGHGSVHGQELWMSELSDLVMCIHASISAIEGVQRTWTLTIVNAVMRLFFAESSIFKKLDVMFILDKNNQSATSSSATSGFETLKLMKQLVDVLDSASREMAVVTESWSDGMIRAHQASFQPFYSKLHHALDVLIQTRSKNVWKFVCKGNWKEFGGFLSLPLELHKLLGWQIANFPREVETLNTLSGIFTSNAASFESLLKMDSIPYSLDVIVATKTTTPDSMPLLDMTIHALRSHPSTDTTSTEAMIQGRTLRAATTLRLVLAATEDMNEPVVDRFGKAVNAKINQLPRTTGNADVRKILEHLKAITSLRDALKDLRRGRLRYLSGLLHNLSRALSDDLYRVDSGAFLEIAGYGPSLSPLDTATEGVPVALSASFLSQMVHYLAEVGDIVSTMDDGPTEGHNYFSMLHQTPQDMLSTLVGTSQCASDINHLAAVADVMNVDLAHSVLTSWLNPLYPPTVASDARTATVSEKMRRMPSSEAIKELINIAPVRTMAACVFAKLERLRESKAQDTTSPPFDSKKMDGKEESVLDCLALTFETATEPQYPVLLAWMDSEEQNIQAKYTSQKEISVDELTSREQIAELLKEGSTLRDAFRLAEKAFDKNPPDDILYSIVEATERFTVDDKPDGFFFLDDKPDPDPLDSVPVSWATCLKIKDNDLATKAAAMRVHDWSLERAIEFYSLQNDEQSKSFLERLLLYHKILTSPLGGEFHSWVEVDSLFERECGQLARKLKETGKTEFALEVMQSKDVAQSLKCELHAAHLKSVGTGLSTNGDGPIAALRFLKTLSPSESFSAGMRVLTSPSCPLNLSRLLVQYLMSIKDTLHPKAKTQLEQTKLGIAALRCLPQQWSEKCAHLVETPSLIVESLIMAQQTVSLEKMMREIPSLRDDSVLIYYARKALGLGVDVEALPFFLQAEEQNPATSFKSDGPHGSLHHHRLSTRLVSSISDTQMGMGLTPVAVLSGNSYSDEQQRAKHVFRGMPNLTLFRVLLNLLSSPEASGMAAERTAADLADVHLTKCHEELSWNANVAQSVQEYVDVCLDILDYADLRLANVESGASTSSATHIAAGPSSRKSNIYLRMEVEMLQKLLAVGIQVSLMDLRDQKRCEALLHRLITAEQYFLAVRTARQCSMDERPYWEAWVIASIQEGNFISARERVPYIFRIPPGVDMDSTRIRVEARQAAIRLVRVLEMTCPVDLPAFFTLHNSLKHSRSGTLFRASAKEIMKFIKGDEMTEIELPALELLGIHEKMKRKDMITLAASSTLLEERIKFCEELLARYAPTLLTAFMFRHGRGAIACQIMYPPGMDDDDAQTPAFSSRGRGRVASDRTGLAQASLLRDVRGAASMSSLSSEIVPESESLSPRTSVAQPACSSSLPSVPMTHWAAGSEPPSWPRRHGDEPAHRRQWSLPELSRSDAKNLPPLGQRIGDNDDLISGVNRHVLASEIENIEQICDLSVRYVTVSNMIDAMLNGGPRGRRALANACIWLENAGHYHHLYECQKALRRLDIAGEICIRLSWTSSTAETAVRFLDLAKRHLQEALSAVQQHREKADNVEIVRSASEITRGIERITLQLLIYKVLISDSRPSNNARLTPMECTMFTESDVPTSEDDARRLMIVQRLLPRDFSLAFRVMCEYRMSEITVYSSAVRSMAFGRQHMALMDLVNNIKGTVPDQHLDQILYHAIAAYAANSSRQLDGEWTDWFAEGLVELMASPHAKVRAFVRLGNIDAAYKLAMLRGARADLELVLAEARERGLRGTVRSCEQILERRQVHMST